MSERVVDVTALVDYLDLMIRIADKMSETQPYLPSIQKLRNAAKRELDRATEALEH
jgi:hypothetical protein